MIEGDGLQTQLLGFVRGFAGGDNGTVATLAGQASTRRYHRVQTQGRPSSCVVMELPRDDRPASADDLPFLNVHRYLSRAHYPVPLIYETRLDEGLIALEDLGDLTLEAAVERCRTRSAVHSLYRRAITLIAQLQRTGSDHPDPTCLAFGRRFDFALLSWELDHFREWLLEHGRGVKLTDAERATLDEHFRAIASTLEGSPPVLVHRDFQSRNIMVVDRGGLPHLRIIDFQDALLGPRVYDAVALLRDSYLTLDGPMVRELLAEFAELISCEEGALTLLFDLQTVQRKLKDAGRFVYIHRVRGNPSFLQAIPASLRYVAEALGRLPGHGPLLELLSRHLPEFR